MHSLREIQQRFADAILSGDASVDFAPPAERMAIYRRTILANYRKALAASYPVVKRLTGTAFFDAAVDAFVVAYPSQSGDLNVYGDAFGDFLDAYPPASDLPYLADVARLEWAIDEAQRASDAPCVPDCVLAALAAMPAARLPTLRLRIDPSCRFVASRFPILRIWQTNQAGYSGDDRVMLEEGADALIVRRGAGGVSIERLAPGEYRWLASLRTGATLGDAIDAAQAADAAFDLGGALREHIAACTVIAVVDTAR